MKYFNMSCNINIKSKIFYAHTLKLDGLLEKLNISSFRRHVK